MNCWSKLIKIPVVNTVGVCNSRRVPLCTIRAQEIEGEGGLGVG